MGQKYVSDKGSFSNSVEERSLWVCCVSRNGKRKKVYASRAEAKKEAKEVGGSAYRCLFDVEVFHVTTHTRNGLSRDVRLFVYNQKLRLWKALLVSVEEEMAGVRSSVALMTDATPLKKIEAMHERWDSLSRKKEECLREIARNAKRLARLEKSLLR